jgi:hypothetical protein
MEVILIFTLQVRPPTPRTLQPLTDKKGPYNRGVQWPMMLMAISATVIQIAGLIPPYFELAKRNGRVIGIGTPLFLTRIHYTDFQTSGSSSSTTPVPSSRSWLSVRIRLLSTHRYITNDSSRTTVVRRPRCQPLHRMVRSLSRISQPS